MDAETKKQNINEEPDILRESKCHPTILQLGIRWSPLVSTCELALSKAGQRYYVLLDVMSYVVHRTTCDVSMPKMLAMNLIKTLCVTSGLQKHRRWGNRLKRSAKFRMSWDNWPIPLKKSLLEKNDGGMNMPDKRDLRDIPTLTVGATKFSYVS